MSTDLRAAVESIRDLVLAGGEQAEVERTLPQATIDALSRTGILAMKLPRCLGGAEADLVTQVEVIERLAYLDAAVGWCVMVGASAIGWPGAFLADSAIADIFAGGRVPVAAVVIQPTGVATVVDGGYRVDGQWHFASGVRHAEWITAGVSVRHRPGGTPRGHKMVVFPAGAAQIHDDWHAAGLEGTGSCGFSVSDLFVGDAFGWDFGNDTARRGGPMYRLGWPGFVAHEPPAFALGVARRALDVTIELARAADADGRRTALAESQTFQRFIGESEMRWRAARALLLDICAEAWAVVAGGDDPPPCLQAALRSVAAFTSEIACDLAAHAFRAAGSSVVYRTSVVQRCWRDLHVAGQHWLSRDSAHEVYGRFMLGDPAATPTADAPRPRLTAPPPALRVG